MPQVPEEFCINSKESQESEDLQINHGTFQIIERANSAVSALGLSDDAEKKLSEELLGLDSMNSKGLIKTLK